MSKNYEEYQYLDILAGLVLLAEHGNKYLIQDRTGVGTYEKFGTQMRFDLRNGKLPLLTTKKVRFKDIVHELLWFISGNTNVKYLRDHGVTIWDEWADEYGDLGPVYGSQWRKWEVLNKVTPWSGQTIDQLANVIYQLKTNPHSRRHIVTAWNPADIDSMALPPCHMMFQFFVNKDNELSCHLYQRSADFALGVPYNIASYSLLMHLVAKVTGFKPGEFVHSFGSYHLYANHVDGAREQLLRAPYDFPTVEIANCNDIDLFSYDDIKLVGYEHHPTIKFPVAV